MGSTLNLALLIACLLTQPIYAATSCPVDGYPHTASVQSSAAASDNPPFPGFAIRRPKPGSIWIGPKEAWCAYPQPSQPGSDASGGGSEVPTPEPSPPPAFLSPLLFFVRPLPTLEEVAAYFTGALGQPPIREGEAGAPQKLRFERWLFFSWGNSWRRCILSEGVRSAPGVTLEWWTNDDFGLSELREFFEAPFFRRCESEQFYQWLGEEGVHETDFRGHRLRMTVQLRDEVLFVRIQWWQPASEGIASQETRAAAKASPCTGPPGESGRCAQKEVIQTNPQKAAPTGWEVLGPIFVLPAGVGFVAREEANRAADQKSVSL